MTISRRRALAGLGAVAVTAAGAAAADAAVRRRESSASRPADGAVPSAVSGSPEVSAPSEVSGPGTITRQLVKDPTGRASPVIVWRPDVPETADIPVVYLLHGVPGTADGAARTGVIAATAKAAAAGLGPMVLVIPDGNGRRADTEWGDSDDGTDLVATRVIDSVLPAVEGKYPRSRGHRALVGFSMGGFGAANLGLQHPDLFAQWASLDGYFRIDDPDDVFASRASRLANSPDHLAVAAAHQRVLLIEGRDEKGSLVPGEAIRMRELLTDAGAQVSLWQPPGPHSWSFVLSQWAPLLTWLRSGWTADRS